MKKIAIPVRYCRQENEYSDNERYYVAREFLDVLKGLEAALIPIISEEAIPFLAEHCDGLLLPGNYDDVDPKYYNEACNGSNVSPWYDATVLDYKAIEAFEKQNKLIMGVCAGMQTINVYYGGSLNQDIEGHVLKDGHEIAIEQDSRLYQIYETTKKHINSYHHQSVKAVGGVLRVTAMASDGTIEALEKDRVLAVQWHPELENDSELFKKFFGLQEKTDEK